ncbi:MAG: porin family protein [Alphaproteobacteria bacterium]|nr:porin family protein [Alphaproteobacteria bacterium]
MNKLRGFLLAGVVFWLAPIAGAQAGDTQSNSSEKVDFYGGLLADFSASDHQMFVNGSPIGNSESSSLLGVGGLVGLRGHSGPWFFGAEADLNANLANAVTNTGSIDVVHDFGNGHLRVLVGQEIGNVSFFAAGGLAGTRLEFSDTANVLRGSTGLGWSIGVGADIAVSDSVSLRIEGLHDQYDNIHFDDTNVGAGYNTKWSENTVRVGAVFKF